jgi:hypothetical protein
LTTQSHISIAEIAPEIKSTCELPDLIGATSLPNLTLQCLEALTFRRRHALAIIASIGWGSSLRMSLPAACVSFFSVVSEKMAT